MAQNFTLFLIIFFISLSTIPVCIMANKMLTYLMAQGFPSVVIASTGVLLLLSYLGVITLVCKRSKERITNWHFYVFALFAATSVIDFGIGLEQDGYISHFLSEYLKTGEPYLFCPYGKAVCYFDGFGMYSLYLYMIYAISNKKSYRSAGLYWAGTLIYSMICLVLGILWGKFGVFPSSSLNIPYFLFPFAVAWKLLQQRPTVETKTSSVGLHQRPVDLVLVALLIVCLFLTVLRGVAVVDNNVGLAKYYLENIEPFLVMADPSPFLTIQVFVYMFYFVPIYALSIYALIVPGCTWMPDLTLFHAGAMAEGQYSLITTALDSAVPIMFQLPNTWEAKVGFWSVNLLILVVPHVLLLRCYMCNALFSKQPKSGKSKEKSK